MAPAGDSVIASLGEDSHNSGSRDNFGDGRRDPEGYQMTIQLEIPEATPSLNKFHHAHWRKIYDAKKHWEVLVLFALKNSDTKAKMKAKEKRKLLIQRYGKKPLDRDNGLGGCKIVIDALKTHGLIIDDDDAHLEVAFENQPLAKGEKPHTVLVLEDLK
jgi:hypothetical protein